MAEKTTTITKRSSSLPKSSSAEFREAGDALLERILAEVLAEHLPEIGRDELRRRVPAIRAELLARLSSSPAPAYRRLKESSTLPSADEIFQAAAQDGQAAIRRLLAGRSRDELAMIVGRLGFDPTRKVRRWKHAERLLDFLATEVERRARRNQIFLTGTAGQPPSGDEQGS